MNERASELPVSHYRAFARTRTTQMAGRLKSQENYRSIRVAPARILLLLRSSTALPVLHGFRALPFVSNQETYSEVPLMLRRTPQSASLGGTSDL